MLNVEGDYYGKVSDRLKQWLKSLVIREGDICKFSILTLKLVFEG